MRKCCVPGCFSNYGRPYVPTFLFPKDGDRRKLWERNIGKQDMQITNNVGVCIKHFLDIYIVRHNTQGEAQVRKTVKLKREAVPSIFPEKISADLPGKKRRRRTSSKGVRLKRQKPENIPDEIQNSPTKRSPQKVVLVKDPAMLKELLQQPCITSRPIITVVKVEDVTEGKAETYTDSKSELLNESEEDMNTEEMLEHEPLASPGSVATPKQDDNVLVIKVKSASKGRSSSIGSNSSNTSGETSKLILSPVPKRRKVEKSPPTVIGKQNDVFCWVCHKDPAILPCCVCKRSFHQRCAGVAICISDWVCPECTNMLQAGNMDLRSKTLSEISMEKFCALLKTCLNRLKCRAPTAFHQPVPVEYYRNYLDFVIHPMDLSLIEKKIKQKLYGCTEVFLADVKWILHNSTVFNGAQHPLTLTARKLVRTAEIDTAEIEICPDCYLHASIKSNKYWFADVCEKPHPIVWAKLKGFPYWPAKIVKIVDDSVDARFFGAHDRAWVPVCQCYHLSKEMPTSSKPKKKQAYDIALEELDIHVKLLNQKYGTFKYAPYRTTFNPENKLYTFHGIDIDNILKKADMCNGTSTQSLPNSNGIVPSVQPDTNAEDEILGEKKNSENSFKAEVLEGKKDSAANSLEAEILEEKKDFFANSFEAEILEEKKDSSANFPISAIQTNISLSFENGDGCPNDSNTGNTDSKMELVEEITADCHHQSNEIEPKVITSESLAQDCGKKESQDDSDIKQDKLESQKKESPSTEVPENDLQAKDKLAEAETLTLKKNEIESFKTKFCSDKPEQTASSSILFSSFDSSKLENFEIKDSLFDTTSAPNSDIEYFKRLESSLEQIKDFIVDDKVANDVDSVSPAFEKEKGQNLPKVNAISNESKTDETFEKLCETTNLFENLQNIAASLNLPQIPKQDLDTLLSDNMKTAEKVMMDDLKMKSPPETDNRVQDVIPMTSSIKTTEDVASTSASKKMDFFALKLGKTIESCKAKLGITDLSDYSSNDSDSGEEDDDDDEDEDDEEEDDDEEDEDGEESENNEDVSDEEIKESSENSDDEQDESELEEAQNKDSVTDIMAKQEIREGSDIEQHAEKPNETMDMKISDAMKPEELVQTSSLLMENHPQLQLKEESRGRSQDENSQVGEVDDPAQENVDSEIRSPIKGPENAKDANDSITHNLLPEVVIKEEPPTVVDDVSISPKPTVIDVIDISISDSEMEDESSEDKSSQKPFTTAATEVSSKLSCTVDVASAIKPTNFKSSIVSNSEGPNENGHGSGSDLKNNVNDKIEMNFTKTASDLDPVGKVEKNHAYSHDDVLSKENSDEEFMEIEDGSHKDIKVRQGISPSTVLLDEESSKAILSSDVPSYLNRITPSCQTAGKATTVEKELHEIDADVEVMDISNVKTSVPIIASVKKQLNFDLKTEEEEEEKEEDDDDDDDKETLKRELQKLKEELHFMKLKYDEQEIYHHQHQLELKHSMNNLITEMRASLETYRKDVVESLEKKVEIEKNQAIDEAKAKQWCALCKSDAVFLCCWNTSYCSHYCQKQHWPKHRLSCSQVKMLPPVSKPTTTEYVKIAKKPVVSEPMETNNVDKKVYLLNMKQPDVITTRAVTPSSSASNTSSLNSLPNVQFVATANQFQKISASTSTPISQNASTSILPKPPVQIMRAPVPHQVEIAQDSADLITKVRSRQTDLNTAIHLLKKMNKETEETLKKKKEHDENSHEEVPAPQVKLTDFASSLHLADIKTSRGNGNKVETDDDSDDVLIIDDEDADGELLRLSYGVEISKKKLMACVKTSTNATRLARSLMEVLIPFKTLAESSVFGRKSNVNKRTRPGLKLEIVNAIIEFVTSVYPSALKTDIVLAMNFKCKEARHVLQKSRTENNNNEDVKRKAEVEVGNFTKMQKTVTAPIVPSTGSLKPSLSPSITVTSMPSMFSKSSTSAIRTLMPRLATAPAHQLMASKLAMRSAAKHSFACNTFLKNNTRLNFFPNIPIKPKPTIVAIENSSNNKSKLVQNQSQSTPLASSDNDPARPPVTNKQSDVSSMSDGTEFQNDSAGVKNDSGDGCKQTSDIILSDVPLIKPIDRNRAQILMLGIPTAPENSPCKKQQVTSESKDESSSTPP